MRKVFLLLVFNILLNSSMNYGQAIAKYQSGPPHHGPDTLICYAGNLLRVNMDQPNNINYSDTLGYWEDSRGKQNYIYHKTFSYYYRAINTSRKRHLLKRDAQFWMEPDTKSSEMFYLEDTETSQSRLYAGRIFDPRISMPYMLFETHVISTPNGNWLLNGAYGTAFLTNDDSLYIYPSIMDTDISASKLILQDIIGNVNDKYVGVFYNIDSCKYEYYKMDLSQSPILDTANFEALYCEEGLRMTEIIQLQNSLYLLKTIYGGEYFFYELVGNRFKYIKTTDPLIIDWKDYNRNKYRNGYLYNSWGDLEFYKFNAVDTSFTRIKYESVGTLDEKYNYAYRIENSDITRIRIYDINKGITVKSIEFNARLGDFQAVDSPYVYFQQKRTWWEWIDIADDINENANLTYKLSAYPNPFNPQTTIAFTIPNAGKVELAVYDLLGRKVTELLNEYRDKGSYEIKFNGANLASGIYFYTIKTGNFVKSQKMMLLK